ncbi:MAG: hypothetical protein SAJ37_20255 [Oscillatoria sp. PMC 1068.18]|nr:hypothetical protein [Oscillatoria sp. PMC 1076.18]MEC4991074.1 hypothetical protein [Oscillatoria sp. PMC 1068.18]
MKFKIGLMNSLPLFWRRNQAFVIREITKVFGRIFLSTPTVPKRGISVIRGKLKSTATIWRRNSLVD